MTRSRARRATRVTSFSEIGTFLQIDEFLKNVDYILASRRLIRFTVINYALNIRHLFFWATHDFEAIIRSFF